MKSRLFAGKNECRKTSIVIAGRMYVCVAVCMCVWPYVCMCGRMYVCVAVCMCVWPYVCVCVCGFQCSYNASELLVGMRSTIFCCVYITHGEGGKGGEEGEELLAVRAPGAVRRACHCRT
jgi:hypothetical protein